MILWLGGIWSLAIPWLFFTDLLLGRRGFERKLFPFSSHQKKKKKQNRDKSKNPIRLLILLEDWTEPAEITQVLSFNCKTSCKEASAEHGCRSDNVSDELEKGICLDTATLFQEQLFLTYSDSSLLCLIHDTFVSSLPPLQAWCVLWMTGEWYMLLSCFRFSSFVFSGKNV